MREMDKKNLEDSEIASIKRDLISNYIYLILIILGAYSLLFYFVAKNIYLAGYVFSAFCFMFYTWVIVRKNYSIERLVHLYLILAPVFNFFLIVVFWKQSVISYMWLLPIPIAAHIFFSKKVTLYYTAFIFINIITAYLISLNFSFDIPTFQNKAQQLFSDTMLFVFNLSTIFLLLYYKDKINNVQARSNFSEKVISVQSKTEDSDQSSFELMSEDELLRYNSLFEKIEQKVKEEQYFKDSDFNLAKLAALLNTNSAYISKSIRLNNYPSFKTYLNICRIDDFKKMVGENDLRKVTLMYLYTESGFSNQSTFNRVFKQLEGITPSEYIGQQGTGIFLTEG